MDYIKRHHELKTIFQLGTDCYLEDSDIDIRFFSFQSNAYFDYEELAHNEALRWDIPENNLFRYPIFIPKDIKRAGRAILLLHGLNERSWEKYLTWAEYLCLETKRPVILFPIAYHMNRSPLSWSNPRTMMNLLSFRRQQYEDVSSGSFANVALSERLSNKPDLFYLSGKQTFSDISDLVIDIKSGSHPLFAKDAEVDIFSYSIGTFLSQVLLLSNPEGLFSKTKLFMFCGGSIFSSMFGISRSIMDSVAFQKMRQFYLTVLGRNYLPKWIYDHVFASFDSMISPDRQRDMRLSFFEKRTNQITGISFKKDVVMPYKGILEAVGGRFARKNILYMDYPVNYSHEIPFPTNERVDKEAVNNSFLNVFSRATSFFL